MAAWLRGIGKWPLAGIAFTGSLCFGLAIPPYGLSALVWLGFGPLALAARSTPPELGLRALALGWVGGLCTGLVGFPWIMLLLERFTGAPTVVAALGLFAFAAWTAIPYGLWVWGVAAGPTRGVWALLWPIILWVPLSAAWPALFPYTPTIGLGQTPAWIQAAELGGVGMVEVQVVATGVLLADALLASSPRARWLRLGAAAAIPLVSYGLGAWRIAVLDAEAADARRVRFGIVQPNTPLGLQDRREKVLRLGVESAKAQRKGAQIMVWPEAGAYPYMMPRPPVRDFADARKVLRFHRLPTILGVPTRAREDPYDYNSAIAMDIDGRVTGIFDKNVLMPFGEYVPLVDPEWGRSIIPAMSHNFAGEDVAKFVLQPAPTSDRPDPGPPLHIGPLICYEDILPSFARRVAEQPGGVDAFVNLTIDTWFGDTAEPWEHLALAQFRSVEHRVPMIRSVAAGPASVVDHAGRVVAALPVTDPWYPPLPAAQHLVHDVALPRNTATAPTFYARGGWLFPWICGALVLLVPVWARARRRTAARSQE